MSSWSAIRRVVALASCLGVGCGASLCHAEGGGPVYKGADRPALWSDGGAGNDLSFVTGRPARLTNRSPGYVGSDYGLGKPSVSGIGPRPDWGRSSE